MTDDAQLTFPWIVLGIGPTTDPAAIRAAYARTLKSRRPDEDAKAFQELRNAYAVALAIAEQGDDDADHRPIKAFEPLPLAKPQAASDHAADFECRHNHEPPPSAQPDHESLDALVREVGELMLPLRAAPEAAAQRIAETRPQRGLTDELALEQKLIVAIAEAETLSALALIELARTMVWDDILRWREPPLAHADPRFKARVEWAMKQVAHEPIVHSPIGVRMVLGFSLLGLLVLSAMSGLVIYLTTTDGQSPWADPLRGPRLFGIWWYATALAVLWVTIAQARRRGPIWRDTQLRFTLLIMALFWIATR